MPEPSSRIWRLSWRHGGGKADLASPGERTRETGRGLDAFVRYGKKSGRIGPDQGEILSGFATDHFPVLSPGFELCYNHLYLTKEVSMNVADVIKRAMLVAGSAGKSQEFVDELVRQGTFQERGSSLVKEWTSKAMESTGYDLKVKDTIAGAFEKLNIPTRDDLEKLEKKIQGISARLSNLKTRGKAGISSGLRRFKVSVGT